VQSSAHGPHVPRIARLVGLCTPAGGLGAGPSMPRRRPSVATPGPSRYNGALLCRAGARVLCRPASASRIASPFAARTVAAFFETRV